MSTPVISRGVAHRDEQPGLLGGHDAGHLGDSQDVAFADRPRFDQGERGGQHFYAAFGHSLAPRVVLGRYVHHPRPAGFIEMG